MTMLRASGLIDQLRELHNSGYEFQLYGDGGYELSHYILRPWIGANLTDDQIAMNIDMSGSRVSVEHGFRLITNNFSSLMFKAKMKLWLSGVASLYAVSTILTNARCCFSGNQVSDYFMIDPPYLDDYFC
jgi:hypothetical protein